MAGYCRLPASLTPLATRRSRTCLLPTSLTATDAAPAAPDCAGDASAESRVRPSRFGAYDRPQPPPPPPCCPPSPPCSSSPLPSSLVVAIVDAAVAARLCLHRSLAACLAPLRLRCDDAVTYPQPAVANVGVRISSLPLLWFKTCVYVTILSSIPPIGARACRIHQVSCADDSGVAVAAAAGGRWYRPSRCLQVTSARMSRR